MTESIAARINMMGGSVSERQVAAVLTALLADITALKAAINTHQHAALNAAPSVGSLATLNTTV